MLLGIKRIYDRVSITDGMRILVDGLWPRGVKKSTANIDTWYKQVAPSKTLRKWFAHDPSKWVRFQQRYRKELERSGAVVSLVEKIKNNDVTLVYSSKDEKHNNAIVLAALIEDRLREDANLEKKKKHKMAEKHKKAAAYREGRL